MYVSCGEDNLVAYGDVIVFHYSRICFKIHIIGQVIAFFKLIWKVVVILFERA